VSFWIHLATFCLFAHYSHILCIFLVFFSSGYFLTVRALIFLNVVEIVRCIYLLW
jgi:hypothetical protein